MVSKNDVMIEVLELHKYFGKLHVLEGCQPRSPKARLLLLWVLPEEEKVLFCVV